MDHFKSCRKTLIAALGGALCALFLLTHAPAGAQTYPRMPIKMVVTYPPGGGADTLARQVAAKMRDKLGQQVIIDNKPGGNTIIGTESGN